MTIHVLDIVTYTGIPFRAVLFPDHGLYPGETKPVVRFYDRRYRNYPAWAEHGRFVSEYYVSSLLEDHNRSYGLSLHGGIPDWTIDSDSMRLVTTWLELTGAREAVSA